MNAHSLYTLGRTKHAGEPIRKGVRTGMVVVTVVNAAGQIDGGDKGETVARDVE